MKTPNTQAEAQKKANLKLTKLSRACASEYEKRERADVSMGESITLSSPSLFTVSRRYGTKIKTTLHSAHTYVFTLVPVVLIFLFIYFAGEEA